MKNNSVKRLTTIGIMAALSYVVFTFLQIKIPLPGGSATSIHLGNAVCVLAALILGGVEGGIAGAIGMTIGDLMDPIYIIYAPKTFLLKFCIGLITGLVAHKAFKLNEVTDKKKALKISIIAGAAGLMFNVIFDPLIGYFYKILILGKPLADVAIKLNIGVTSFNAVISLIASTLVYMAVRPYVLRSFNSEEENFIRSGASSK